MTASCPDSDNGEHTTVLDLQSSTKRQTAGDDEVRMMAGPEGRGTDDEEAPTDSQHLATAGNWRQDEQELEKEKAWIYSG